MAELTPWGVVRNEHEVLDAVRALHRATGAAVPTWEIRNRATAVAYHSVDCALAGLVSTGLIWKPRRGYYLPTEERST